MPGNCLSELYRDRDGFYSLEIEIKTRWYSLSEREKEVHLAFLKGMYYLKTDPFSVSASQKLWLIRNCNIDIFIIPIHYHKKYPLTECTDE